MRKGILGRAAGIGALAIASMLGGAQASQPLVAQTHQSQSQGGEMKATRETRKSKEAINVNAYGGLDFPPVFNDFGVPPHIYGAAYGHGNKASRSNRLRLSHNAKLKRRRAA